MDPQEDTTIEFRIATSVLETIARGALKGEQGVRLHQSAIGRSRGAEVVTENGSCRATIHLDAQFGRELLPLAAVVQQRVREALESMTGLSVPAVDVVFEGVLPRHELE